MTRNSMLRRKQQQPNKIEVYDGIYTWRFCDGEHDWRKPFDLSCTLFKKRDLMHFIKELTCPTVSALTSALHTVRYDLHNMGMYNETAHASLLNATYVAAMQQFIQLKNITLQDHNSIETMIII